MAEKKTLTAGVRPRCQSAINAGAILCALLLLGVYPGFAFAQAKECDILRRALYGDKIVDSKASLSGSKIPGDLLWPVYGAQATSISVGKGEYFFSFRFSDAAGYARADAIFVALDNQVAQCLLAAKRVRNGDTAAFHTYCPPDTPKIVTVSKLPQPKFLEVLFGVNTVSNRAKTCR
jgi:hypothetical protein